MHDLLRGESIRFMDCSIDNSLMAAALNVMVAEQQAFTRSRVGLCREGLEINPQSIINMKNLNMIPKLCAVCTVCPIESEGEIVSFQDKNGKKQTLAIKIKCVALSFRSISLRQSWLQIITRTEDRQKGWGKLAAACSIYQTFVQEEVNTILARVPLPNLEGMAIAKKYMKPIGTIPYDWLWYGNLSSTMMFSVTSDDLLFDLYDTVSSTIKESGVDEQDPILSYDGFRKVRLKE